MKSDHSLLTATVGTAVFAVSALALLAGENSAYLQKVEELSLFICDWQYLKDCLAVPGGLLTWISSFLTQFFHLPWLGSSIMVVMLIGLWLLISHTFRFRKSLFLIAALPSVMLLLAFLMPGYLIYTIKTPGFPYACIVGSLFSVAVLLLYKSSNRSIFHWAVIIVAPLSYPLFGFYSLLASLLCILSEIVSKKRNWVLAICGAALTAAIPQIIYYLTDSHLMRSQVYISGLPRFAVDDTTLWAPYIISFSFLVLASLFSGTLSKIKSAGKGCLIVSCCLFVGMIVSLFSCRYRDKNFSTFLKMDLAADRGDYESAINAARALDEYPTRTVSLFTHMALFHSGKAGDLLFSFPLSDTEYASPLPNIAMRTTCSRNLLYRFGRINDCYRWSMEDMVEYGPKVEYLKYLAKCALLNGEPALAKRYLHILSKTLFHKGWAEKYLDYADHPEKMDSDKEFAAIRPLMAYNNHIGGDGGMIESYLSATLSSMAGGPPPLVELSLQFNLMRKDIAGFWPRFILYANSHDSLPRHYQEAAILFSTLERHVDWRQFNIDADVAQRFEKFMDMARQNSGLPDAANLEYFKPRFGDTYWYYYFFVKNLKTT